MTEQEQKQSTKTDQAIDEFNDKTIKIDGRVFRIGVEYIENMLLEVTLTRLSTGKSYRSTQLPEDFAFLDEFEKRAYNMSLRIAKSIETDIETDYNEDDI